MRRFPTLVAAALLALACGNSTGPGTASVDVFDNTYAPSSLSVSTGTTVTWTWAGTTGLHDIIWADGASGADGKTTGTYSRTFANAGTYSYYCSFHADMKGVVTVQ